MVGGIVMLLLPVYFRGTWCSQAALAKKGTKYPPPFLIYLRNSSERSSGASLLVLPCLSATCSFSWHRRGFEKSSHESAQAFWKMKLPLDGQSLMTGYASQRHGTAAVMGEHELRWIFIGFLTPSSVYVCVCGGLAELPVPAANVRGEQLTWCSCFTAPLPVQNVQARRFLRYLLSVTQIEASNIKGE